MVCSAMVVYALLPALNHYAGGWEYPSLLTGVMRLVFIVGTVTVVAVRRRSLLSCEGLRVMRRVMWQERKLFLLAMLTTGDCVLFSLSYRYVDISVSTVLTAFTPAASVVFLALLTWGKVTWRQMVGLAVAVAGVPLVMMASGPGIQVSGQPWAISLGVFLGAAAAMLGGLVVAALRLGETLALEWFYEGVTGGGKSLVWLSTMVALAAAQGITAPLLVLPMLGRLPSLGGVGLMLLMGVAVAAGTLLWSAGNGSGWQPVLNSLGYLQPLWALLILVALGISDVVHWGALAAGATLIVGANFVLQLWGRHKVQVAENRVDRRGDAGSAELLE